MTIPGWLERVLRWGLWMFRPKYLVGVFPICIDDVGRVLLIRKRLGAAVGWQLPGGAKPYGTTMADAACQELESETGLITVPSCIRLVRVQCVEAYRDMNIAFLVHSWDGEVCPRDTMEIAEARWVHIPEAYTILYPLHRDMLTDAVNEYHGNPL